MEAGGALMVGELDATPAPMSPPGMPGVRGEHEAAAAGRREEFGTFYVRTFPDMVRLARVLVDSSQTAEDLVQDAYVAVHRRWGTVREPVPYLRRAVVNRCRSYHRRSAGLRRVLPPGVLGATPAVRLRGVTSGALEGAVVVHEAGDPDPGAAERRSDDAVVLAGALIRLPARQRCAVVLRYYADLSDAQIAEALGCRVGTVASLVHRALAQLREVIQP